MLDNPRIAPSPDQLRQMLHVHLSFEIGRFRKAASLWSNVARYSPVEDAMIRESCLIHMRLLLDFFYPRVVDPQKRKHVDIFVSDYVPAPEWRQTAKELADPPSWLPEFRNRLDCMLAHLTMKRFQFDVQPEWKVNEQFGHVEKLIVAFLTALPADMKAEFDPTRGWLN